MIRVRSVLKCNNGNDLCMEQITEIRERPIRSVFSHTLHYRVMAHVMLDYRNKRTTNKKCIFTYVTLSSNGTCNARLQK